MRHVVMALCCWAARLGAAAQAGGGYQIFPYPLRLDSEITVSKIYLKIMYRDVNKPLSDPELTGSFPARALQLIAAAKSTDFEDLQCDGHSRPGDSQAFLVFLQKQIQAKHPDTLLGYFSFGDLTYYVLGQKGTPLRFPVVSVNRQGQRCLASLDIMSSPFVESVSELMIAQANFPEGFGARDSVASEFELKYQPRILGHSSVANPVFFEFDGQPQPKAGWASLAAQKPWAELFAFVGGHLQHLQAKDTEALVNDYSPPSQNEISDRADGKILGLLKFFRIPGPAGTGFVMHAGTSEIVIALALQGQAPDQALDFAFLTRRNGYSYKIQNFADGGNFGHLMQEPGFAGAFAGKFGWASGAAADTRR
jgi:hypothetical protein